MSEMAYRFYAREKKTYGVYYRWPFILNKDQIERGVVAICEKYRLPMPEIRYSGRKWHKCMWKVDRLQFVPGEVSIRILAHELAHYVRHKLLGCHKHNEELMSLIGELIAFLLELLGLQGPGSCTGNA